eukprot:TRINITY_DN30365_c0_g1_i1.p1 TRINITY_DN30365_c0_g1~~TRINITY_DN30365_c0_g1_i1.p1  ORF type:complete len:494 (-),score=152.32 TRINITY_DN30365_c0_g1_i1:105-1586(-)
MGGAASAKKQKEELDKKAASELAGKKQTLDDKHGEVQRLEKRVNALQAEVQERQRLEQEMAEVSEAHAQRLELQRQELEAEHQSELFYQKGKQEREAEEKLGGQDLRVLLLRSLQDEDETLFAEEISRLQEVHSLLIRNEEQRVTKARLDQAAAHSEARALTRRRDSERAAAQLLQDERLAEQRAVQRQDEETMVQVRTRLSEVEALRDAERGLESEARSLQHELSRVCYAVGQRDHELDSKGSELQEVRSTLAAFQEGIGEVNSELEEQCERVRRAETTLRHSEDLTERLRSTREMLRESHSALGSLCGLLEQERAKKEQYEQGLRQQRVRTELLLQLLQHFKNRTQELAPQAVLGQSRQAAAPANLSMSNVSGMPMPPLGAGATGLLDGSAVSSIASQLAGEPSVMPSAMMVAGLSAAPPGSPLMTQRGGVPGLLPRPESFLFTAAERCGGGPSAPAWPPLQSQPAPHLEMPALSQPRLPPMQHHIGMPLR